MNFYLWLVGGLLVCVAAGWWIIHTVKRSNEALRSSRQTLEVERLADEDRASREASDRDLHRQRIAAQQAARADLRRRAEAQAQLETPPVAAKREPTPERPLPPIVVAPALAAEPQPIVARNVEPLAAEPVGVPAVAPPVADPDAEALAQPLVLIADDSKVVRVKTGRILAQHPYRVCFASDGLEAWQAMQANRPAVLITDVDMPGLDGFELTRRLRADPATARIPVIMITAADATHRAAAAEAGVDVVLGKPFSEAELLSHVQAAVRRPGLALDPSKATVSAERSSTLETAS